MDHIKNRLYQLLPKIYRHRDQENSKDKPLQTLLAVMEKELSDIEARITQDYDNCFIETCEESAIPKLADLLGGLSYLRGDRENIHNVRLLVANTIHHRRRKGQTEVIEDIVHAVMGNPARIVEDRYLLSMTQSMRYPRPQKGGLVSIRSIPKTKAISTPFDSSAHTVQILTTGRHRDRYALNTANIFIWPLTAYAITNAVAYQKNERCHTFDPLGIDRPLFYRPSNSMLPSVINPDEYSDKEIFENYLYGSDRSFCIWFTDKVSGERKLISADQIVWMDLQDWSDPPPNKVAVDTKRGRIKLYEKLEYKNILVNYYYGYSGDLGGGSYSRIHTLKTKEAGIKFITCPAALLSNEIQSFINDRAVNHIVIEITDNGTAILDFSTLEGSGKTLTIQAADYQRPCLILKSPFLSLQAKEHPFVINLNGLWISGSLQLKGKVNLNLLHSTVVPNRDNASITSIQGEDPSQQAHVTLNFSIVGPLHLSHENVSSLRIGNSIVDGFNKIAITGDPEKSVYSAPLSLARTTVLGAIQARSMNRFSENIVTQPVVVESLSGCLVRYSYLLSASQTPPQFRCQSDLGDRSGYPIFVSTTYGQPGYAKLNQHTNLPY